MSDEHQIPLAARELIRERIHSIEALELIVALRERRDRAVPAQELAGLLRVGTSAVETALAELERVGLIEPRAGGAAQYAAESRELDEAVEALIHSYEHLRVETLVLISSNALHRVRDDALRTFAEAFRLGGKKRDG